MKIISGLITAFLLIGLIGSGVSAQKTAKPWTEWTEQEAKKMLDDSAWARTQASEDNLNRTALTPLPSSIDVRNLDQFGLMSVRSSKISARLLSAQPIRQAFARMIELKQKNPSPDMKQQLQAFVDRKFDDWIVVAVDYEPGQNGDPAFLRKAFAEATMKSLKSVTYLEVKGGKRLPLQDYKAPINDGLGAKFIFPRTLDGKPFVATDSGDLRFSTELATFLRVNARFKVTEMTLNGVLEY